MFLLDLLYPPRCPFCSRVLDEPGICWRCDAEISKTGAEALWKGEDGLVCAAPFWYRERVRDTCIRLKFHGGDALAEGMGRLIAQCAAEELGGEFDIVTWMPVGKKRRRERGYDQAELLAKSACRVWKTKPVRLLRKAVENPAQSGMADAAARAENVKGVYEAVNVEKIRGAKVLLIDDICTTGATLGEGRQVLLAAGAAQVVCAALAKTPMENEIT